MIAYEKHTADGQDVKQQKLRDHFEELRERQRLAQREFHQKLFTELQKEVGFDKKSTIFPLGKKRSVLMEGRGRVQ